ncbi:MAG TPA: cation:proton antiporter [bacterium]|nr:cation:proton antiporter [bacterium]
MRRVLGLLAVCALIVAVRLAMPAEASAAAAAMALGFVLLVSFVLGRVATRLGLPTITGYILVGMVTGPFLLGWLHPALAVLGHSAVSSLRLLDGVALGLIALSAGGELRLAAVRRHARTIAAVIAGQVLLVFAGVTMLVLAGATLFPSLQGVAGGSLVAMALLFAVIATANSPATALAIIQEYRSEGPVTDVVLAVTVVKDVVVISLFTIVLAFAVLLARPGAAFDAAFLLELGWEVAGSVALGVGLAWLVALYVRRVGHELPLLILGVAFVAVAVLPALHLSGLLALMVAGFVIENFTAHGDDLIQAIERHSLPVYVVFFTIAGASLDLGALGATLPLALALALVRGLLTAGGTALGARLAHAPAAVQRHGWSGFVAQAGVTLGFAILVEQRFPEIGFTVKTVVLAVIALNQLAGPVLFRLGLFWAGEARPEPERAVNVATR